MVVTLFYQQVVLRSIYGGERLREMAEQGCGP